jgi:hypothetical protein
LQHTPFGSWTTGDPGGPCGYHQTCGRSAGNSNPNLWGSAACSPVSGGLKCGST